jgi:hypothetical protein
MTTEPKRVLSLGAGVQSTTLLLLSAKGELPKLDAAIFADTGWEPKAVYEHLNRVEEEIAKPAGIPIYRVSYKNIRDEELSPDKKFAQIPYYVMREDGKKRMGIRQCTYNFKIKPVLNQIRLILGAEEKNNGQAGRLPWGVSLEQWIGISTDEVQRAKDSKVKYIKNSFPLLDIGWSRKNRIEYLSKNGFGSTPKSACIGCPFHGNKEWKFLRDNSPEEFQDAVDFDNSLRSSQLPHLAKVKAYLHTSYEPLESANLDKVSKKDFNDEQDLFTSIALGEGDIGCSPFSCRTDAFDVEDIEIELKVD